MTINSLEYNGFYGMGSIFAIKRYDRPLELASKDYILIGYIYCLFCLGYAFDSFVKDCRGLTVKDLFKRDNHLPF